MSHERRMERPYHNQKQALEQGKDFAQEDFSLTVEIVARHEAPGRGRRLRCGSGR